MVDFLKGRPEFQGFLKQLLPFLDTTLPLYERDGRTYLTIGVGCTGGMHRSVALVEELRAYLKEKGYDPLVRHRDIAQVG